MNVKQERVQRFFSSGIFSPPQHPALSVLLQKCSHRSWFCLWSFKTPAWEERDCAGGLQGCGHHHCQGLELLQASLQLARDSAHSPLRILAVAVLKFGLRTRQQQVGATFVGGHRKWGHRTGILWEWEYRRRRLGVRRWESKGVHLIPLSGRWD